MTRQQLSYGNTLIKEIDLWEDIKKRIEAGPRFFSITFQANETKSMQESYSKPIVDDNTIEAFKKYAESNILRLQQEFEKL